ncbi:MAG: RsmB/NOP family class I SAM-dependent RNA methyltransferase, partial [Planctomycetota bacterium]
DRVPDHAAVAETVAATNRALDLPRGRFVNALLRRAIRERGEGHCGDPRRDLPLVPWHLTEPWARNPDEHPFLWFEDALSCPSRLAKAWDNRYGAERARRLAEVSLIEPPLSIRVVDDDLEALAIELDLEDLHPVATTGRTLLFEHGATEALLASDAFTQGRITVQGGTATRAAELVDAQSGERILDLCAAPGGKTAVLARAGASVVACDVEEGKLERLHSTLERLGVADQVELCLSDGTRSVGESGFDAVLVDAPCSNTGVLAARPEARWRYQPQRMSDLRELQSRLLREGADRVRDGGRLVWSTCSLEPSENTGQVKNFLRERPEWTLEEEFESLPDPESGPVDGGYAARLRRGSA